METGYSIDCEENPDWGFARNQRVVLRRPQAEMSLSVFSASVLPDQGIYMAPNRDFSYEGLNVHSEGENWKYLDSMAFGVRQGDQWLDLKPTSVTAHAHKAVYHYDMIRDGENVGSVDVDYFLLDGGDADGITGRVRYHVDSQENGLHLSVSPLVDIRHMYDGSSPHEIGSWVDSGTGALFAARGDRYLLLGAQNARAEDFRRTMPWGYKLGSGSRTEGPEGIVFREEWKHPTFAGKLEADVTDGEDLEVVFAAGRGEGAVRDAYQNAIRTHATNERAEEYRITTMAQNLGLDPSDEREGLLLNRAVTLANFGIRVGDTTVPEAGGWWFRNAWFRDAYEGVRSSYETYRTIKGDDFVKDLVRAGLKLQDDTGRIPNKLPERAGEPVSYNAVDATLLCIDTGLRIAADSGDRSFSQEVLGSLRRTLDGFSAADPGIEDGAPVVTDNGLIRSVAWHTWTDSKRWVGGHMLPERIPRGWEEERVREVGGDQARHEFYLPSYFLPEVNAQWLTMLSHGAEVARNTGDDKLAERCESLHAMGAASYKDVFWNDQEGFLYNLVDANGRKDDTRGSPAVVAASMLGTDVFSKDELRRVWDTTRDNLLIERGGKAFGILVKDSDERIYYGDEQYHEAVVWPRDTPYLIGLLESVGEEDVIRDVLDSNLAHMVEEQAVFYNNELFSLPEGRNPSPNGNNEDPVPVKNPVQYWSQWMDAYLHHR